MTSLDFLAEARRWQGPALLEGLRQAPARIQFAAAGARAGQATRLAKVSPGLARPVVGLQGSRIILLHYP